MVLFYVLLLIGIPFIYAAYLYPSLPEIIPTHFNIKGEADGFGGKDSIYLGPSIMGMASLFTYLFLTYIKKIDPKRSEQMEDGLFQKFGFFTVLFLTALSMVILYATTHQGISIEKLLGQPCCVRQLDIPANTITTKARANIFFVNFIVLLFLMIFEYFTIVGNCNPLCN